MTDTNLVFEGTSSTKFGDSMRSPGVKSECPHGYRPLVGYFWPELSTRRLLVTEKTFGTALALV